MKIQCWGWVMLGMALVILGLGAYNSHLRTLVDKYAVSVAKYKDAQETNLSTISVLSDRARSLASQNAEKSEAARALAERNKRMFDALNEALANRKTVRETVYVHDKAAGDWANNDVPDAVADSLR